MKHKQFKISGILVLFVASIFAQKTDKKFTEQFSTNKDVVVEINASNADIDVQTWNKNQVAVEATIEVAGLSKKEAEKYLNNWKFEALGNKSKVVINAKSNGSKPFVNGDYLIFNSDENHFPIVIPEMPEILEFPEILLMPEINEDFDVIVLPEGDWQHLYKDLDAIEFDYDKYFEDEGKEYFFQWKDDVNDVTIKSKKEWEAFKKTKEYKKFKESMKKSRETMKKSHATMLKSRKTSKKYREIASKSRKEAHKKAIEMLEKSRFSQKEYSKKIREALAKAQKSLKKSKLDFTFLNESGDITINGKKVKITKKITIKVPKGATFNLNTRHCKVKLPKGKTSGKVSYGTFNSEGIQGGDLKIDFAPVQINSLNASNLFLNNVTDANLASVTNTVLNTNSSEVKIKKVYDNVDITSKFGDLLLSEVLSGISKFNLNLHFSEATINLSNLKEKLKFQSSSMIAPKKISNNKKSTVLKGFIEVSNESKTINLEGKNSKLTIIK